MSDALRLAEQLITRASVTPDDAGCQDLVAQRLTAASFECRAMPHGPEAWTTPPFVPSLAYPHLARNPPHVLAPALAELVAMRWDEHNAHFPATIWQVGNLHAGTGARNVIPGTAELEFNCRYSPESTPQSLQQRVIEVLARHGVDHHIDWTLGAEPFLTEPGTPSAALTQAIQAECGLRPVLSTTGGTSDGRFIRRICPQVVEFGPVNASSHLVDERVEVASDEPRKNVDRRTLELLLA